MLILLFFAFLAGVVTILSPCILPILPIVLSGAVGGSKKRPLGIILGFILSFTFFTLFLAKIVQLTGIPSDSLRIIAAIVLLVFGFSLFIPNFQVLMEKLFTNLDRQFENYIASTPYGANLTSLEQNDLVTHQLNQLKGKSTQVSSGNTTDLLNADSPAPDFTGITKWLNPDDKPLHSKDLKG